MSSSAPDSAGLPPAKRAGSEARASHAAANEARLIFGFVAAVTAKGYGATTIADIVREARVSKRTFYEHFEDKDACFLAAYRAASGQTLNAIALAVDLTASWDVQIRSAIRAYLELLEANAALTRTFLLEVHAAGPRALAERREIHGRFAQLLLGFVGFHRMGAPDIAELSPEMAAALVGGINELVLVSLEGVSAGSASRPGDGGATLRGLEDTATELVRAVLLAKRRSGA